ncbi:MAG TPA: ABC transporter permease [Chloroflexota bacterium]|nr:ABC transporter permease [Chloroflexota bacterium]
METALLSRVLLALIPAAALAGIWIWVAAHSAPAVVPGPDRVLGELRHEWQIDLLQPAFATTLLEALGGWAIGAALALPIGYATARWLAIDLAVSPYIAASQVVPVIAVAPLLFEYVGFGMELKIVIAAIIAFFPVAMTTAAGIRGIDRDLRDVARVFGASWAQTIAYLEAPRAARSILSGLRIAAALAVTGAFVGELVNPDQGLGAIILSGISSYNRPEVFAGVIGLVFMGAALFTVITIAERIVLAWTD